jgi:Luciferase
VTTGERIAEIVGSWPDVETAPHRFGGVEFKVGRRELGHIHGDRIADLPFPRRVRDELVADGRARPHHVLPDSGWVTIAIARPEEADNALELFRMAYERALNARRRASA